MIFIDTGAFLGRYIKADQHHVAAVAGWQLLMGQACATSNHVIDETLTLLARRADYRFAAETARRLYASKLLTILRTDQTLELGALELFSKYGDQEVSFTDCLSFALLAAHGIKQVFSFDRHFQMAGFEPFL